MRYDSRKFADAVYLSLFKQKMPLNARSTSVLVQLAIHNRLSTGQQPSNCFRRYIPIILF